MGVGEFAKFKLVVEASGYTLTLGPVLITDDDGIDGLTILVGTPDLKRNRINVDIVTDEIVFPDNTRLPFESSVPHTKTGRMAVVKKAAIPEAIQQGARESAKATNPQTKNLRPDSLRSTPPASYAEAVKSDPHPKVDHFQIDARDKYLRRMEKLHAEKLNTYTIDQVNWHPDLLQYDPELKKELEAIMWKYRRVFSDTIGRAPDRYAAKVVYEGRLDPRAPLTRRNPAETEAICKHLDEEFCNGVLVFPDQYHVRVENFLRILCVAKKDDDGRVLPWSEGMRLVVACNESLNPVTKVPPMKTDDLKETQKRALRASKDPYMMKCDVKKAFLQVPRPVEDWGKTCIDHPIHGTMCYTSCVMGWVGSMGIVRNTFQQMFADFDPWLFRFMDDIFATAPTRETFLRRFEALLQVLDHNNLRLSGKKMYIGSPSLNFVGAKIGNGRMEASPHHGLKAISYSPEELPTISKLRSFLAFVNHLCKFMFRSVEFLKPFTELTKRPGTDKVPWDENGGKLRRDFSLLQRRFRRLTTLHAFDPAKTPFIFVDSSALGQGAILCQKKETGGFVPIEFFSRSKSGKERKTAVSSCIMEVAGLSGAIEAFRHHLESTDKTCVVFTDSKSLCSIATRISRGLKPSDVNLVNRFFANLIGLRLQVVYLAGKTPEIEMVDYISRTDQNECTDAENCQVCKAAMVEVAEPVFVANISKACHTVATLMAQSQTSATPIVAPTEGTAIISRVWSPHYTLKWAHPEVPKPRFVIAPVSTNRFSRLTVQELLKHPSALQNIQDRMVHVAKAKKHLLSKATLPPKGRGIAQARTLIHTLKAQLTDNQILWYQKQIGLEECMIVPVPAEVADLAVASVHNQYGHRSATQMYQFLRRHYDLPNARTWVVSYLKRCPDCAQHSKGRTRKPIPSRAIPEPQFPGEVLYADEITRTHKNKPLRFMFITDALTRYGLSIPFDEHMNSRLFTEICIWTSAVLGTLGAAQSRLLIRTDGHRAHVSAETQSMLKSCNIDIEVHQSMSGSKNIIPAQDARIKTLQNLLTIELAKGIEPKIAVALATKEYNRALTDTTLTPAEMLFRRTQGAKAPLTITDQELRERILTERRKQREVDDRLGAARATLPQLTLIKPHSKEHEEYKSLSPMERETSNLRVFKVGDLVKLNKEVKKLECKLWKVLEIDWDRSRFWACKKEVTRVTKASKRQFRFNAISEVITDTVRRITGNVKAVLLRKRRMKLAENNNEEEHDPDLSVYDVDLTNELHYKADDSGMPATPMDFEDSEPAYSPELTPVPETELTHITQSLTSPDPVTSSPVHDPEIPVAWKDASLASTIPPLEADELTKVSNWSQSQEETPDNLQLTQTPKTTESDPQIDILASQLESVVTMTPKAPQRHQGLIPPHQSKTTKETRPKQSQTAQRSRGPPARRPKRTREQTDPESCSKRNKPQQSPGTVNDTEPEPKSEFQPSAEPSLMVEEQPLRPFEGMQPFEDMSESDSPADDLENDPDYESPCASDYSSYHSPEMEISYSSNPPTSEVNDTTLGSPETPLPRRATRRIRQYRQ